MLEVELRLLADGSVGVERGLDAVTKARGVHGCDWGSVVCSGEFVPGAVGHSRVRVWVLVWGVRCVRRRGSQWQRQWQKQIT